jgi:hypothetical protein
MPVVLGADSISVDGKVIEIGKFVASTLPFTTPVVTPVDVATGFRYFTFPFGYQYLTRDATNLVAWYKMENNLDSSGNGFNLTLQGAAAISTDDGILANKYLVLNGANNYADIPLALNIINVFNNVTTIGGTEVGITISFWFKATGAGSSARIIDFSNNAVGTSPSSFFIINSSPPNINFSNQAQGYATSGINFYDGNWRHVCWSIDINNKWYIYINGSIVSNGAVTGAIPNLTYTKQYIGRSGFSSDGYLTGGGVEDFRIYNVVLTAAEVLALSNITKTSYTVKFPNPAGTLCDILIVGGGGAGGNSMGGGGGAGGVVYAVNQTLNAGSYVINVGNGGAGKPLLSDGQGDISNDGVESSIQYAGGGYVSLNMGGTSRELRAFGGGGGGIYFNTAYVNGRPGGSGGGSTEGNNPNDIYSGGAATQPATLWNGSSYVAGGYIGSANSASDSNYTGGGGGGAGGTIFNSSYINGKTGVQISISGTSQYYAAGGGGAQYSGSTTSSTSVGLGGNGIGGNGRIWGGSSYTRQASSGQNSTGSGGGGGAYAQDPDLPAGSGGSGIVIIRYSIPTNSAFDAQWTYNTLNANVYYGGNVGIGTQNPTSTLYVVGNTFSTTYSASSKTFKIEHPLKINKWLYHGCIEGPRFDNIYRGKKRITEGKADIDIDTECNTTGGMTPGTFPILNKNTQLFLRNNQTYDRVKGKINGSIIKIECENITDEIEIDWMVVGERHDEHVINTPLTDSDGNLICEHEIE